MKHFTTFDEKRNTLYIATDEMLPDTKGMSVQDRRKAYDAAYAMDYAKRLELYGCEACKKEVAEQMEAHKGCKLNEFTVW